MSLRSLFARAVALCFVAAMSTGCCELIAQTCNCIGCLLSGPSLPGLVVKHDGVSRAFPEAATMEGPRGAVRASMAY